MFYLNDVQEGGETEFYYQDLSIKPRKGTMVIAPAYFTHTHRGNVPISNDKYILTSWVQFNQANVIFGQPTRWVATQGPWKTLAIIWRHFNALHGVAYCR